jgi:hypothetical protein
MSGGNEDYAARRSNYLAGNKTFQPELRFSSQNQNFLAGIKNIRPGTKLFAGD